MPRISPRRSVNVAPPGSTPFTSSSASPGCRAPRENSSDGAAPTMSATIASAVASAVEPPPTLRPSRRTTNRSVMAFTSSMKCEM
jgi:hypothetical protein